MCYINYQDDEIANEFVELIGIDDDGDFYIDFYDGCTSYEDDLENNCDDAWDLLWSALLDHFGLLFDSTDNEHEFNVGDAVYWNNPAINDYSDDDALKRRFVVFNINGEIISISDTYTTAEVYASELEHIS
jgi:hypothetical protein